MLLDIQFLPYPMLVGMGILAGLLPILWRKQHRVTFLLCVSLFWVYVLLVLGVMFFPFQLPDDWPENISAQNALWTLSRVNLIPFKFGDLFSASAGVITQELAGNILLTMPFGFGLPFLVRVPARRILWIALIPGLALEGTQLLFGLLGMTSGYGHSVDINDVMLNTIGALAGYGVFRGFGWLYLLVTRKLMMKPRGVFEFLQDVVR